MSKFVFAIPAANNNAVNLVAGRDFEKLPMIRSLTLRTHKSVRPAAVFAIFVDTETKQVNYSHEFRWPIPESWRSWKSIQPENVIDMRRQSPEWIEPFIRLVERLDGPGDRIDDSFISPRRRVPMNPVFSEPLNLP